MPESSGPKLTLSLTIRDIPITFTPSPTRDFFAATTVEKAGYRWLRQIPAWSHSHLRVPTSSTPSTGRALCSVAGTPAAPGSWSMRKFVVDAMLIVVSQVVMVRPNGETPLSHPDRAH